ncbi:MAG: RluA family pseudouridine synthase [Phycisphaerales bacterium]
MSVNLSIKPNDRVTFKVRHEDDDLAVIDKPAGVVTQPGKGHEHDSLLNGLFGRYGARLQNLGNARDFGLLHRLDRATSGLVLIALRPRAYDALRQAFARRQVRKFYWAITGRTPSKPSGVIRRPILEVEDEKKTGRVAASGKPALTAYRVLQASTVGQREAALIECRPVTGRLHQVRLHLESIGCPILGDDLYGPRSRVRAAPRLALHAHRLAFTHPGTGETVDVSSPFPKDLASLLRRLGMTRPDAGPASVKGGHEVGGDAVGEEEPGVGEAPAPG